MNIKRLFSILVSGIGLYLIIAWPLIYPSTPILGGQADNGSTITVCAGGGCDYANVQADECDCCCYKIEA